MPANAAPGRARLSRQKPFEASHRYWVPAWSDAENWQTFGPSGRPHGHGHNYVVWATVEGAVDPGSGMFMNLVDLDQALAEAVAPLDHRFLNVECAHLLRGRQPSTETLALVLWEGMGAALNERQHPGAVLAGVRVLETPDLWADAESSVLPLIRLTRGYTFSAAHRLVRGDLDEAANQRLYGKCANPHGHGHDYRLEVTVRGEPDPLTGLVADLATLDAAVQAAILDPWDHRHLNFEVRPFDQLIPTSENVVRVAWDRLYPRIGPSLEKLTLYETPRGAFEYWGDGGPA